jgi:hypothetical protein
MKKIIILFCCLLAGVAAAQINTNIVIISGAGNMSDNVSFTWDTAAGYYTNAGIEIQKTATNLWQLDGGYFSTNFPYTWYNVGFSSWPPPNPTGVYAGQISVGSPLWMAQLTNYWTQPGDYVSFDASGRNMATTNAMTGIGVVLDGNTIYQSTLTAGNGSQFSLGGRLQWDGTNINYFAQMTSGDPSNAQSAVFGQVSDAIGTNSFQILPTGNTNGFILLSATISASRAPQGFTAPTGTTTSGIGSISFHAD